MDYIKEYEKWLIYADENTKNELLHISEDEKKDRFYRDLEFGTGGLRGVIGAGNNRMNIYTVRKATQGLANEIISCNLQEKGVVIAYDSRNMSDIFAKECAKVLRGNGIKVYLFESLRPTPELSFAVRHLGCGRGVVITASHNPKQYNGYKVYGEDGGQVPPSVADKIYESISTLDIFKDVKVSDKEDWQIIGEEVDKAYISSVKEQSLNINIPKELKVVYTPLHGSGNMPVRRILKEIGIENVFVVPEQEKPDGNFSTVKSPNPEDADALKIAMEYAKEISADVVIGTDPDSDRVGVALKNDDGEYVTINGNQTGSLLLEFILRKQNNLSSNAEVVKTIVTTELVQAIADAYNVKVKNVLTGFKFIGEEIKRLEDTGDGEFLFGLEESYGYLKGTYARDKDAVVASMLICEMVADYKNNNMTLFEGLKTLYKTYGYFKESLNTATLEGMQGASKIKEIMKNIRENPPADIFGHKVVEVKDYSKGIEGLPKSDVLKFILTDGWLAVRPSGTEPKIKFYFGIKTENEALAEVEINKFIKYSNEFCK